MIMKLISRRFLVVVLLIAAAASSCGVYKFSPAGRSSIRSIAVERFENETVELGLTDLMTDGVINAFIADGNLNVVPPENADAVLVGTLLRYERGPYQFTAEDVVESYAVTMTFDIVLKKPDDGSEIWKEEFTQNGIYDPAAESEEDGQQKALERLVEAIINRTTNSW